MRPGGQGRAAGRRPRGAAAAAAAWALLAGCGPREARALVDCTRSTNCDALRRRQCDVLGTVPNACGNCLVGNFGASGPTNSYCLSNASCAALYPAMTTCPLPGINGTYVGSNLPLVLPFDQCVCDSGDGMRWPTAPGACAKVSLAAGLFTLQRCASPACEASSCTVLTSWVPVASTGDGNADFECRQVGSDSLILASNCATVVGSVPDSAFCGNPGLLNFALANVPQHVLRCQVAPRCPASVIESNLELTCCVGTDFSSSSTGDPARGFCARDVVPITLVGRPLLVEVISASGFRNTDTSLQGNSDPYCVGAVVGRKGSEFRTKVVFDTQDPVWNSKNPVGATDAGADLEFLCWDQDFGKPDDLLGRASLPSVMWQDSGFDGTLPMTDTGGTQANLRVRVSLLVASDSATCAVRIRAPSWQGCACLARDGWPMPDRSCTVACTLPSCGSDGSGIPATPAAWVTSDVPSGIFPAVRSSRSGAPPRLAAPPGSARAAAALAALAALAAWAGALAPSA